MKKLIAFSGKKFSGKSTAAAVLTNMGYTELKFADPLKNMLYAMYETVGVPHDSIMDKIEGSQKESPCEHLDGKTPRYAMQTLGTEWRDMIDENLWTNMFKSRASYCDLVVCSDMRFPHEVSAFKELGGTIIRIRRDEVDGSTDTHSSEAFIDSLPFDHVLENNGTVEDFVNKVQELIDVLE